MNWYYVEDNQQRGPVSEAELDGLAQAGKVIPGTLVWREGMANWQPYAEARGGAVGEAPAATVAAPVAEAALPGAGDVVCSECGGLFSRDQAIQYGTSWVCANCKPMFVQKLKEGASVAPVGVMVYAGFWIRFVAYFVDQIILGMAGGAIGLVIGLAFGVSSSTPEAAMVAQIISSILGFAIGLAYYTFFNGKYGATPGKMVVRIKIVTAEGLPISYGLALGRYFAAILSGIICGIGYIMVAFDEEKRALHDRICNTRVIRQ